MLFYLCGSWQQRPRQIEVVRPFDGQVLDTVPQATGHDVTLAIESLREGARQMRALTGSERCAILRRAVQLLHDREAELAQVISQEEGKILAEGRLEATRARETLDYSADEARRLCGEMVPLDGAPSGAGRLGFTLRVPCGIVAAITPFNFPLNLVAHKVGPALAAGNAVLLKPASDTPLSALKLVEILLEAGLPPLAIACLTGPGHELGQAICTHPLVRKISFTGSHEIGEAICRMAGVKRVTMELGSNSPVIVLPDADLEQAAKLVTASGYSNAGQVCISAQRVLVIRSVYQDFLDALAPRVESLRTGDPLDPATQMGPMVREADARRVEAWIGEAVAGGARVVAGGGRQGTLHQPTLLADVPPTQRVSCEELFGPAVAVTPVADLSGAIELANASRYGLAASLFTRDLPSALRFVREVESGNLHVNWGTQWRADLMPYGGLKDSGLGKEGPRHAILEMTEEKMVVFHP